jgi:hypothetical protein
VIAFPVAITRARPVERKRDLTILAGLVLWLVYTRGFWALQAAHLTMPPCPFFYLTGHPCPFCGGTRSFAYMWQGDIANSVRLYPLGPALFVGTFLGAGALACHGTFMDAAADGHAVAVAGRRRGERSRDELGFEGVRPRQLKSAALVRTNGVSFAGCAWLRSSRRRMRSARPMRAR